MKNNIFKRYNIQVLFSLALFISLFAPTAIYLIYFNRIIDELPNNPPLIYSSGLTHIRYLVNTGLITGGILIYIFMTIIVRRVFKQIHRKNKIITGLKEYYQMVFEELPLSVFIFSNQLRLLHLNPAASKLINEWQSKPEIVFRNYLKPLQSKENYIYVENFDVPDTNIHLNLHAFSVKIPLSTSNEIIITAENITARVNLEKGLAEHSINLELLQMELESQYRELSLLHDLSGKIQSFTSWEEGIQFLIKIISELYNIPKCVFYHISHKHDLINKYWIYKDNKFNKIVQPMELSKFPELEETISMSTPLVVTPIKPSPVYLDESESNYSGYILFPINIHNSLTGSIQVFLPSKINNLEEKKNQVQNFISQACVSLENFILYNEIRNHTVAIEYLNRELSETVHNLKISNSAKSEFVSMVSHELRTPLTVIKTYTATLLKILADGDIKTQRDFLDIINSETDRLTRLIDNLLDFSHIEKGMLLLDMNKFDLILMIEKVLQNFHKNIQEAEMSLETNIPFKLAYVMGDLDKLVQVFTNLLSNAIKYNYPRGRIGVRLSKDTEYFHLEVRDTGPGIPSDEQENIFQMFTRLNPKDVFQNEGSGLGLYISRKIMKLHKGKLTVDSKIDKGSKFTMSLPVYDFHADIVT